MCVRVKWLESYVQSYIRRVPPIIVSIVNYSVPSFSKEIGNIKSYCGPQANRGPICTLIGGEGGYAG